MAEEELYNYGMWYYMRYFPSQKRLFRVLSRVSGDVEVVGKVYNRLAGVFIEARIIQDRVRRYIEQGKTSYFIRQKLREKEFDVALVDEAILLFSDQIKNPETYKNVILSQIDLAQRKCLPRKIVEYRLIALYPDAKPLIRELLSDYSDENMMSQKIPELLKKYTREKAMRKLCQQGFSPELVYRAFRRL